MQKLSRPVWDPSPPVGGDARIVPRIIAAANPGFGDEQVFQVARKIVGAEIQKITYEDWLPTLIGAGRLPAYSGYKADVDASVASEFSAAAFRVGGSWARPTMSVQTRSTHSIPLTGQPPRRDERRMAAGLTVLWPRPPFGHGRGSLGGAPHPALQ